jgi:hypothetical protein
MTRTMLNASAPHRLILGFCSILFIIRRLSVSLFSVLRGWNPMNEQSLLWMR